MSFPAGDSGPLVPPPGAPPIGAERWARGVLPQGVGSGWRGLIPPVSIGFVVAAVILLVSYTDLLGHTVLQKLEYRMLDYAYVLRDRMKPPVVPRHPDIALVLITPKSEEKFTDARVEWTPHYADTIRAVLDGGATAVGVDFLLSYYDEADAPKLAEALAPYPDKVVLIGYMDEDPDSGEPRLQLPATPLLMLVGPQNIGLANLTRDLDEVPRAGAVFPVGYEHKQSGVKQWMFFAPLLAEKHLKKQFEAATGTLGDTPLPLMGATDWRVMINYAGSTLDTFKTYDMSDVAGHLNDSAWLKERFDGKVVLIADGMKASQDITTTPFSAVAKPRKHNPLSHGNLGNSMLGIEVQAHFLNTLLTGAWLRPAAPWANALILIVLCVITAVLVFRLRSSGGALATLAILVVFLSVSFDAFVRNGVWVQMAAGTISIPLVWGTVYSYRYAIESRRRAFVQTLFGRYVSPEVMHDLLKHPDKLMLGGSEWRVVTIFFIDINGFTPVCETRTPDEVFGMLNNYMHEVTRIIFRHGGTVKQYVGDEIMVLFGAPRTHPEPERAAVLTAVDVVKRMEELRAADPTEENGFYHVKIGIHTGRVMLGNLGSAERTEYSAIGDAVNLASRIMGLTKTLGGPILISAGVYEKAKDLPGIEFARLGQQEIRGRQNSVGIYQVFEASGKETVHEEPPAALQVG